MGDSCCNHIHINGAFRTDPTLTTTLRKQFEAEFYKRFRRLKGRVRDHIIKESALSGAPAESKARFQKWLKEQEREILFDGADVQSIDPKNAWTAKYIASAYQKGVNHASAQMRAQGIEVEGDKVFQGLQVNEVLPNEERAELAMRRSLEEYEGVTDAMNQQISRSLSDGLRRGDSPYDIADEINNRVDKVGITRARTLARTEVVSAHAEASLNSYERAGVEGVGVQAEFQTAGDGAVCDECVSFEGRLFSIDDARGVLPIHPNCRCAFVPFVPESMSEDERQRALDDREQRRIRLKEQADLERAQARANPPRRVTENRKEIIKRRLNASTEAQKRQWLNSVRDNPPVDFEGRQRRLIDNWTRGSRRKTSVELKRAAREELGFGGIDYSRVDFRMDPSIVAQSRRDVRTIYDSTQEYFRRRGQKTVTLYRGLKTDVTTPGSVASWTADRRIAESFNGGRIMKKEVPVERILTGRGLPGWEDGPFGNQEEFLVLGGG